MIFIKIKNKIKKIIAEKYFLDRSNLKIEFFDNKIEINDFKISFSEFGVHEVLNNIDFEKNLGFYESSKLNNILNYFKNLDISKILISKITFFYDLGFYYNGYAEFLYCESQIAKEIENPMRYFNFDLYDVEIGEASDQFKLIFSEMTTDKYFVEWDLHPTLKIKRVNKENFEKIIQIALFFISRYSPSQKASITKLFSYYDIPKVEESKPFKDISKIIHEEPLIFYEKAVSLDYCESSFIYFYKVLEYFFLINRRGEYDELITNYNNSIAADRIDTFIKSVSKFPNTKEIDNLTKLINNSNYQNEILTILSFVNSQNLSSQNFTLDSLAKKLYSIRNSIVHGKYEHRLKLSLPRIIQKSETEIWVKVIKQITEVVIDNFCFEYK